MTEKVLMGKKEITGSHVMEQVKAGGMTLKEAAAQLRMGYRQAKRDCRRYKAEGAAGLPRRNQGKPSNSGINRETKESAIKAYRRRHEGFGPAFAAGKLAEHEGITVNAETLRLWLTGEGLWKRRGRDNPHRSRRGRGKCFGEPAQFDGSRHGRFEGRRGKCRLVNTAGGATGRNLPMLSGHEATEAAMAVLPCRIRAYGIPRALYCGRKNAFASNRGPGIEEQLAGIEPQGRFEKACIKLGIRVIAANGPRAKGRVERNRAVGQDRFAKELRLAGISTAGEADKFPGKTYLPPINAKFARPPACNGDGHAPLGNADPRGIPCFEGQRVVSRGFIASFRRRLFRILPASRPPPRPGDKVTVRARPDKTTGLYFQNQKLSVKEIHKTTKKRAA